MSVTIFPSSYHIGARFKDQRGSKGIKEEAPLRAHDSLRDWRASSHVLTLRESLAQARREHSGESSRAISSRRSRVANGLALSPSAPKSMACSSVLPLAARTRIGTPDGRAAPGIPQVGLVDHKGMGDRIRLSSASLALGQGRWAMAVRGRA